jgi:hypothetical protein
MNKVCKNLNSEIAGFVEVFGDSFLADKIQEYVHVDCFEGFHMETFECPGDDSGYLRFCYYGEHPDGRYVYWHNRDWEDDSQYSEFWGGTTQLKKRCQYKDFVLHGCYNEWYRDGGKKVNCYYNKGKLVADYTEWYEKTNTEVMARTKIECYYEPDGAFHGPQIYFSPNGSGHVKIYEHGILKNEKERSS